MPLRIGFDLDGTVADMYSALHVEALKLFGEEVVAKSAYKKAPASPDGAEGELSLEPEDSPGTLAMAELHLTARQQMQLWDHVRRSRTSGPRCRSWNRALSPASPSWRPNGTGRLFS